MKFKQQLSVLEKNMRGIFFIFILTLSIPAFAQFYYGSQQEFGKNRVQYQPFSWTYYGFERYQVYMYEGGQELAQFISKNAEREIERIEHKLDFQFEDKLQIIVFKSRGFQTVQYWNK